MPRNEQNLVISYDPFFVLLCAHMFIVCLVHAQRNILQRVFCVLDQIMQTLHKNIGDFANCALMKRLR